MKSSLKNRLTRYTTSCLQLVMLQKLSHSVESCKICFTRAFFAFFEGKPSYIDDQPNSSKRINEKTSAHCRQSKIYKISVSMRQWNETNHESHINQWNTNTAWWRDSSRYKFNNSTTPLFTSNQCQSLWCDKNLSFVRRDGSKLSSSNSAVILDVITRWRQ